MIERYLQGGLTPEEEAAFEEAYLSDPHLLEQVELAERLQRGLRDLDAAGRLKRPRSAPWLASLASPQYAAAASILLVVSLAFSAALYRQNLSLQNAGTMSGGARTRLEPLITVRGNSANAIDAPAEGELVVLLVDPGFGEYDSFRARVSRLDPPEVIFEVAGLEPGYEDYLAVTVPGGSLSPGDYEVVVEGRRANAPADAGFEQTNRVAVTVQAPADP